MGNRENPSNLNNSNKDNISGWVLTSSFGSSIISGLLLGLVVENHLDISPYGVITGIILGALNGYYRLWVYSKRMSDER